MVKPRSTWIAVAVAACGAGCADVEATLTPFPVASPDALGPCAIGVTTLEVTGAEDGRTLPVEVWYPRDPKAVLPPAEYVLKVGVLELARVTSPLGAVRDAPADPRGAPYPVVLFSHGNGGVRFQSYYLTEYLATHGFVVAAPDHTGNTLAEMVNQAGALPIAEAARVRPLDISRTLDDLLVENTASVGLFSDLLDPERVGVAGHSFGGYTAFRLAGAEMDPEAVATACEGSDDIVCDGWDGLLGPFPASARDTRILAALPQSPGGASLFAGVQNGLSAVTIPTMVQGGTMDQSMPFEPECRAPFEALGGEAYLLGIQDAGHFTFSNMCDLVDLLDLSIDAFDDGCGDANIPPAQAHAIANQYATAFFQSFVAGDTTFARFLDPTAAPVPGVATFESR